MNINNVDKIGLYITLILQSSALSLRHTDSTDSLTLSLARDIPPYQHPADECKFLLIAHEFVLTSPSLPSFMPAFLRSFARWEVSGRTAAVFQSAASRIFSKQHAALLSTSHLDFTLCALSESMWCCYIVVLTLLKF